MQFDRSFFSKQNIATSVDNPIFVFMPKIGFSGKALTMGCFLHQSVMFVLKSCPGRYFLLFGEYSIPSPFPPCGGRLGGKEVREAFYKSVV
jgi:hypothetical protein